MRGLDPRIHLLAKGWIAGPSQAEPGNDGGWINVSGNYAKFSG
jgi:hypothetical protein